jgi:hypothetical protein
MPGKQEFIKKPAPLLVQEWVTLDKLLERALITHNNLDIKIARSVVRRIALEVDIKRNMLRGLKNAR